jgi:hypothetical protein
VTFELWLNGSVGSSSLREKRTWERRCGNLGDQWRHSGERRKSSDQDFVAVLGSLVEPLARSWIKRF